MPFFQEEYETSRNVNETSNLFYFKKHGNDNSIKRTAFKNPNTFCDLMSFRSERFY